MAGGSLQLYEYPKPMVRLACENCGRSGQYRKETLIARYGADTRLPDLRYAPSEQTERSWLYPPSRSYREPSALPKSGKPKNETGLKQWQPH